MRSYFAYGSNMDKCQMATRCPSATLVGLGKLSHFRFLINSRGVASIAESPADFVHGVLWSITEQDEKNLDRYEGVAKGYYFKRTLAVESSGQIIDALVYVASSNGVGEPRPGYMERIVEAAVQQSMPCSAIDELKGWLCDYEERP